MNEHIHIENTVRYTASPELRNFVTSLIKDIPSPHTCKCKGKSLIPTDEDWDRYTLAFITPGYRGVMGFPMKTNKTLELVGDAAIELAVTDWLTNHYGDEDVGKLSYRRQCIVANDKGLTFLGKELNLEKYMPSFVIEKKKVLPSVFEALVGAMYTHLSYEYVLSFISDLLDRFADAMFEHLPPAVILDLAATSTSLRQMNSSVQEVQMMLGYYRSELYEFIARRGWPHSAIEIDETLEGHGYSQVWTVTASMKLGSHMISHVASRSNKKDAKGEACRMMLEELKKKEAEGFPLRNPHNGKRPSVEEELDISQLLSSTPTNEPSMDENENFRNSLKKPKIEHEFDPVPLSSLPFSSSSSMLQLPLSSSSSSSMLQLPLSLPLSLSSSSSSSSSVLSNNENIQPLLSKNIPPAEPVVDYKGLLATLLARHFPNSGTPLYDVLPTGPPHDPKFVCTVTTTVNGKTFEANGEGRRKVDSGKAAAKVMIEVLSRAVQNLEISAEGSFVQFLKNDTDSFRDDINT